MMARAAVTELELHNGAVPRWLFNRMTKLSSSISKVMIEEVGTEKYLEHLADPFWFQALTCALGFDHKSSGATTVTCAALKKSLAGSKEIGVCGGKGEVSLHTPEEISEWAYANDMPETTEEHLCYVSRMTAKVDTAAIQDGHRLYHHAIFFDHDHNWTVVQQGMADQGHLARRYQWSSKGLTKFVEDPHTAIIGSRVNRVLNMTDVSSEPSRQIGLDLVNDGIKGLKREISVLGKGQRTLSEFCGEKILRLEMPRTVNWKALERAYDTQPASYEELLSIRGVGPSAVKALALVGELVHGEGPSWKDPVSYSFDFGGANGVPVPIRNSNMSSIELLCKGIEMTDMKKKDRKERCAVLLRSFGQTCVEGYDLA